VIFNKNFQLFKVSMTRYILLFGVTGLEELFKIFCITKDLFLCGAMKEIKSLKKYKCRKIGYRICGINGVNSHSRLS